MMHISRLLSLGLAVLVLAGTGVAQERQQPNRPNQNRPGGNPSVEQWQKQQQEAIDRKTKQFMNKMGDLVPEEKKPRLQQIVQIYLVEELKIRLGMQAARNKAEGDREAMRAAMTESREKMQKLKSQAQDAAKKLFEDKKVLQAFNKNLNELSPQAGQGGRPGQGGGGQGGRGQGGGGGQGGGSGR